MDEYDPATVYSSIDRHGRYAYANQPNIGLWNLTRLAECFVPLLADDVDAGVADAEEALDAFAPAFQTAYQRGLGRKLGLMTEQEADAALGRDLLKSMHDNRADFTNTFRALCDAAAGNDGALREALGDDAQTDEWLARWRQRLVQEPIDAAERRTKMQAVNPAFIPRNHRVEAMIRAAVDRDELGPFEELLTVLSRPYQDQPDFAAFKNSPQDHERVHATFCGT
jgi:uncharacterized protein YdiU (UPF0061 family)